MRLFSVSLKMKRVIVVLLVCSVVCVTLSSIKYDNCCHINSRQLPYYKLMKANARSNQLILSRTKVQTVNECREFALIKKALAFNYGWETDYEWNMDTQTKTKVIRKTCQALQCPEIYNVSTLVEDKNYKYYSAYPSFMPLDSSFKLACIPRTGIFVFSNNNLNYSQAQTVCQSMNATLAHIISEERTNGLGKHISLNTPAFVGLSKRNDEAFWRNEFAEPLLCFNYRAWGKGQPSHFKGCIGLVGSSISESGPSWKVVPCNSKLPFICEISPLYR